MQRIDDLQNGYKIIQDTDLFLFGMDAVLLSNFIESKKDDYILDIGTGNGIIPILLNAKLRCKKIVGVDIQEKSIELAKKSAILNGILNIEFICADINDMQFDKLFDVIVSNPPYMKKDSLKSNREEIRTARSEEKLDLDKLFKNVNKNLKNKGKFYMIHRPFRLTDIIYFSKKYNCEAKKIRFINSYVDSEPILVMIEFVKCAKSFLKILPNLVIYESLNVYTDELKQIYK